MQRKVPARNHSLLRPQREMRLRPCPDSPGDKNQAIEADEDRIAAYHEAGHAVAARAQGIGVEYATIEHEEGERGRIALEQEPGLLASIAGMERLIRVSLAGPMAQQRACGEDEIDQERAGADMIIVRALFIVITGGNIDRFPQFI